jgi:uncharacterized membrane protein YphA (DoxX/SURF4 family)
MKFKNYLSLAIKGNNVHQARWVLRILFGLLPILMGLDKFLNIAIDWSQYLNPSVANIIPVATVLTIAGTLEILAGILVLSKATRVGAYVMMLWLLLVSVNLASMGFLHIAVLDLALATAAYATAKLWSEFSI